MTQDVFTSGAVALDERSERAQRAVRAFRAMQPGLSGYARAITGRKEVQVELAQGVPRTDGTKIFFKPPIALGDLTPHDRAKCERRDRKTKLLLCDACRVREEVLITIYHEIAHIVFGTFAPVTEAAKIHAVERAVAEVPGKFADRVRESFKHIPDYKKNDYLNLASLISPYLPVLVNALEDARVDDRMFKARKGTKVMFDAYVQSVFASGVEQDDGSRTSWADKPLNSQALIGVFVLACRYNYKGWFHPTVEAALGDARLRELAGRIETTRSAEGSYNLAFPILARLRELGFCKLPEEEPEEEQSPEPEEEPDETPENEETEDGDDKEEPEPDEGEGDDSDSSDGAGSGESADQPRSGETDASEEDSDQGDGSDDGEADDDANAASDEEGGAAGSEDSGPVDDAGGAEEGDRQDPSEVGADAGEPDAGAGADDPAGETDGSGDPTADDDAEFDEGEPSGDARGDADGPDGEPSEDDGSLGSEDSRDAGADGPEEPSGADADAEESPGGGGAGSDGMASEDAAADDRGELTDEDGDRDGEDREEDGDGDAGDSPADVEDSDEAEGDLDEVEVVDSGADEGEGGTTFDRPEYGTPEQSLNDVQVFGKHEAEVDVKTPAEVEDDKALDQAIIQGMYFERPSANVAGVREHKYGVPVYEGSHNTSVAWTDQYGDSGYYNRELKRLGIDTDLNISEQILGPALNEMRRAFSDNQRAAHERHLKSGKINAKVLGKRAPFGDQRLFQKKRLPGKRSYAVIMGIDISGSTVGVNLALAKRAAMAQAELCARMGIDFAIYAHTANGSWTPRGFNDLWLDMYEIKSFDAAWNDTAKAALKAISADSENLDGHGVEYYRRMVERHSATDKIILYYSDGKMPAANHDEELEILQREIAYCKSRQITLLGVGIRTDSPRRHGLDTVQVDDDSDIAKVVRHLQSALLHNR